MHKRVDISCTRCSKPMEVLKGAAKYTTVCYNCKLAVCNGHYFWMSKLTLVSK